jgi:hypothetical protein
LISFVDGNQIELDSGSVTLTLDALQTGTVDGSNLSMNTLISATGPFYGAFDLDGTDAVTPFCTASDLFIYPSPRYTDILDVMALHGDASVSVYDGATLVTTQTVSAATPMSITGDVADGNALKIESDVPVLVHRRTDSTGNAYDAMPYLAPDTELVGANSGNGRLVALEDNTLVELYHSTPDATTVTLNASEVLTLDGRGAQGDGDAIHILSSGPVAALSYGDGDGGESITFLPRRELGTRYLIGRDSEYLLVSAVDPGVTCRILDSGGQVVAEQTGDTIAPPYPNRIYFGATGSGSELNCDRPVFAMAEDAALSDERNLWPAKMHRPSFYPELEVGFLPQLQTRYAALEGTITTPTEVPSTGVSAFLSFRQTSATNVPAGSQILYQLSDNGGTTWYHHDGVQWSQAVLNAQANPAHEVNTHIRDFAVSEGSLTVKAILKSDNGTVTPELDELTLDYAGPGEPVEFVFDTIDGTQVAGIPFPVAIHALDSNGLPARDFAGTARLSTWGGNTFPNETPPFADGLAAFDISVSEVGHAVVITAMSGAVVGSSNPFPVVAPDVTGLALEFLSGDQQVGTVSNRLAVDPTVGVTDADTGHPVPGVQVVFTLLDGGGWLEDVDGIETGSELVVTADAGGRASVHWYLGPEPGANLMEARLEGAEGSPIQFEARGDPLDYDPDDESYWAGGGGGCACRGATVPEGGGFGFLLFCCLLAAFFVSRRR